MTVALGQINPTVGDIDGNVGRIRCAIDSAKRGGASLIVLPELAVLGYPPKDLLLRADLLQRNERAVARIAEQCVGIAAIVGYVRVDRAGKGKGIRNAAALCRDGVVAASYDKMLLPSYDVFDETRYFDSGSEVAVHPIDTPDGERRVGITICEDLFNDRQFDGRMVYGVDPIERTVAAGADLLVNLSASPFAADKQHDRERIFSEQINKHGVPLVFVNQVGGNDDLLFDGASLVLDGSGKVIARAKALEPDARVVDLDDPKDTLIEPYPDRVPCIRQALILGIRDYLSKCGFRAALIGLSGGIDSALTAALAVEALGADRVVGVAMPSRFSSDHSVEDARALADHLGIELREVPIDPVHVAMEHAVSPYFAGLPEDVADENIQARIRGNILMAISNKLGYLLLSTGNKSEMAVGYCTLYGDMCGGLAVLSDVPKTVVYELARLINATSDGLRIPLRSIEKPPSAELRKDQTDQDSLPPYEVLDAVLAQYVEDDRSVDQIVDMGFERSEVQRIVRMVDRNEYKRKQAPVGLKVTTRAFGTGRRLPIAAEYPR